MGFAIKKADEDSGARNTGIPDLNDLFQCRSFRVAGNEILGRQPQERFNLILNWLKYSVGDDKQLLSVGLSKISGSLTTYNANNNDVSAVTKDLSML